MRRIVFDPTALSGSLADWFIDWEAKARTANVAACQQVERGEAPRLKSDLWSELKRWLLKEVFGHKCAYCETDFSGVSDYGAAEHYRPKGAVKRLEDGRPRAVRLGDEVHPGYYWLAHDWHNLIPACDLCNTGGKADLFPIAGRYVFSHTEVSGPDGWDRLNDIEQPLILHPYFDTPESHLRFGSHGTIAARDESVRGRVTIEVCDLERERLREKRMQQQEQARSALLTAWATAKGTGEPFQKYAIFRGSSPGRC
jgi:hypothetical protein